MLKCSEVALGHDDLVKIALGGKRLETPGLVKPPIFCILNQSQKWMPIVIIMSDNITRGLLFCVQIRLIVKTVFCTCGVLVFLSSCTDGQSVLSSEPNSVCSIPVDWRRVPKVSYTVGHKHTHTVSQWLHACMCPTAPVSPDHHWWCASLPSVPVNPEAWLAEFQCPPCGVNTELSQT